MNFLGFFRSNFHIYIKQDKYKIVLLIIFLWSPNIAILLRCPITNTQEYSAIIVYSFLFLLFPLIFFKKIRSYFLLLFPVSLLTLPYIYVVIKYNSIPSDALMSAILHTGFSQTVEMISAIGWIFFAIPLSAFLYIQTTIQIDKKLELSTRARKLILLTVLCYLFAGIGSRHLNQFNLNTPAIFDESIANLTFPSSVILSISRSIAYDSRDLKMTSAHAKPIQKIQTPLVVILVIGESCRADHLGLNGYSRNTTPRLSALGAQILSFKDVASTANWTYGALQNISWKNLNANRYALTHTFKEAGFKTAWISNQEFSPYGEGADMTHFSNLNFKIPNDMTLITLFESFLSQAGPMQFVVLHTYGSHSPYDERYGQLDNKFTPTLADIGVAEIPFSNQKMEAINSYDNTILQMDIFLSTIIERLMKESRPAIMLYTSDHGENLFDDERNLFMHTQFPPTRHDTHVPLLIWMNSHYRNINPSSFAGLESNLNKKLSHTDLFTTLLFLSNLTWDESTSTENFASVEFIERPRKIITVRSEPLDFDSLK